MPSGDETLPLGDPPILEHQTPSGLTELAQRLISFPFTPPDVNLKQNDGLSTSNDWFTTHDKNKILFTAADFNTVKANVDQVVNILTSRKDKSLFLDASLSLA